MSNPTTHTPKPGEKTKTLLVMIDWHEAMAESLSNPILPDDMDPQEKKERVERIKKQVETHLAYAQAIRTLLAIRKHQRAAKGNGSH